MVGKGKYKVFFEKYLLNDDIILIVGGGQRSHVGGVVICEPKQPVQILELPRHYDTIVLKPLAIAACKKYDKRVTVLGGIHIDNASKKDIETIVDHCKTLAHYL
jgi:hypothetical protein